MQLKHLKILQHLLKRQEKRKKNLIMKQQKEQRDKEILKLREPNYELGRLLRQRHSALHLAIPEEFLDLAHVKPSLNEILTRRRSG